MAAARVCGLRCMSTAVKSKDRFVLPLAEDALPRGFSLTGLHCGVKKKADVLDLAVLSSTTQRTAAAGVFTTNAFRAAPVFVSEQVLRSSKGRANSLVVNSGCANAVTGERGMNDAWAMARATASESLVMSTGVIGQHLPIEKVVAGIRAAPASLGSDSAAWMRAARAFMTTDTFPKVRARSFNLPGWGTARIAGITKGAGMIHPEMVATPHATLLGVIATDAPVSPDALRSALSFATDRSFNAISVDGDTSTNDALIAFANGAAASADAQEITETDTEAFAALRNELTGFAAELAQLVVRDGEGATKFVTVDVRGARSFADAQAVARTVSTSALVKTALFGEDANWGRVLAAVGRTPLSEPVNPNRVSVSFIPTDGSAELKLLVNGEPEALDEARAKTILEEEDLEVRIDLGMGKESTKYWTCDFSHEYVTINGSYRS
ncbi:arginine biosynthesis protein ArgJ [Exidia glandulosa HHB12029]|uniref:Arginine biosynthesis bifunctional protein ArgJ, mitochondrial n=1 Tax=Exidia glandulosa HHB12029 TaxID=1314781 RepID=A0A165M4E7_EXIGL|nr:arginine biosynthesis protein ArgJ [Exidia glandulosa HHB12029]